MKQLKVLSRDDLYQHISERQLVPLEFKEEEPEGEQDAVKEASAGMESLFIYSFFLIFRFYRIVSQP
jgi:hypothetical protein